MPSSDNANPQDAINIIVILYKSETKNLTAFNLPIFSTSSLIIDSPRRLYLDIEDLSSNNSQIVGTKVDRDNIYLSIHPKP